MNFVIHFFAPFRGHPRNGVIALEQRPAARVLSGGAYLFREIAKMLSEYVQNASKMCRKRTRHKGLLSVFFEGKSLKISSLRIRPKRVQNHLLSNSAIASAFAEFAMSIYGFIAL